MIILVFYPPTPAPYIGMNKFNAVSSRFFCTPFPPQNNLCWSDQILAHAIAKPNYYCNILQLWEIICFQLNFCTKSFFLLIKHVFNKFCKYVHIYIKEVNTDHNIQILVNAQTIKCIQFKLQFFFSKLDFELCQGSLKRY